MNGLVTQCGMAAQAQAAAGFTLGTEARWWENGNLLDSHNGVSRTTSNVTISAETLGPFTGWVQPNRSYNTLSMVSSISGFSFSDYTIFGVWKNPTSSGTRAVFATDSFNNGDVITENSASYRYMLASGPNSYSGHGGTDHSYVLTRGDGVGRIYVDGVLQPVVEGASPPSTIYRVWNCQFTQFYLFGVDTKSWSTDDVAFFHNSGSYRDYASI